MRDAARERIKDVGQMKQVLVYGMCECGESVEREVTT